MTSLPSATSFRNRFATQPMQALNATLIVAWDSATQYATVYKVRGMVRTITSMEEFDAVAGHDSARPVATLSRARVYSKGPAWTLTATDGFTPEASKSGLFDSPRSLLIKLALHLVDQHRAATEQAHSTTQPQGQPLTLDMVDDYKAPAKPAPMQHQVGGSAEYPDDMWSKARTMVDDMARHAHDAGPRFTITTGHGGVYAYYDGIKMASCWAVGDCLHVEGQPHDEVTRGRAIELVCRSIMGLDH